MVPPPLLPFAPPGHLAGNHRRGGQAAGDRALSGRRHRAGRRPGTGDPLQGQSRAGPPSGADPDYQRRHDAAGGRRQGGRGHPHGDGRLARGTSAVPPRAAAAVFHLRRGDRPRRGPPRHGGHRRRGLLHARRPGERPDRRRDLLGRRGRGDRPRREHPSVDCQGTDEQRGAGGGPLPRRASPRATFPRDHRQTARGSCIPIKSAAASAK